MSQVDHLACTPIQTAYIVGAGADQPLGGTDCVGYVEFAGEVLSEDALRASLGALRAHPLLRCVVSDPRTLRLGELSETGLVVHDLRDVPDVEVALEAVREELCTRPFDLGSGDSWRVELSQLPDGTSRLHVAVSLVVTDLAGIGRMMADLACLLRGEALTAHTLDDVRRCLRVHHPDPGLPSPDPRRAELLPAPELPTLSSQPSCGSDRYEKIIEPESWAALDALARRLGTTTTAVVLAVYEETLRRWSTSDAFIVTVTGVDTRGSEAHVADRTRTYAHRSLPAEDVEQLVAEAAEELRYRLRRGVEATEELRNGLISGTHDGLSPYVFTFAPKTELFPSSVTEVLGDVAVVRSTTPQVIVDCQVIRHTARGVTVSFDVRRGVLQGGVAEAMFDSFIRSVETLIETQERGHPLPSKADVARLDEQTERARARVNSSTGYPGHLLHGAFFDHARQSPGSVALVWETPDQPSRHLMTYGELSERALNLAGHLTQRCAPGAVVGVRLPKGPDQIVAVLAVLAAGCAYLPLGVDQPQERVDRILEAADVATLVDEDFLREAARADAPPLMSPLGDPGETAYIIYTSGSTGAPKGVIIRHESAANTVFDVNARHGVGPDDRTLAVSALDFDLSVYDIFGPLSAGGSVVLIDEASRRDAFRWAQLVSRHDVTLWNSVPSLAEMLCVAAEEPLPLRRVMCSGDWIDRGLPERLVATAPGAALVAMGGATEASIWSNEFVVCSPADLDPAWPSIPYGVPLSGQRYRVADASGRDCPDGVPGELWIGGLGVAQGYQNAPELTAERFVTHAGERWYRTGDRGMWSQGPLLFFLGRDDAQVKVRGHRIECGEVEHALRALDGVCDAVVVPIRDRTALGAVLVGDDDLVIPDPEALAGTLPNYMIPARFTRASSLQLTSNGKVDRRWAGERLEEQHSHRTARQGGLVTRQWAEVLGRGGFEGEENFFSLGGDSLLGTKLCSRLREHGIDVTVADLFAAPRLSDFERLCGSRSGQMSSTHPRPEKVDGAGHFALTPLQRAYAMGSDGLRGVVQAPTSFAAVFSSSDGTLLSPEHLADRATALVARFEGLRCRRVGESEQEVGAPVPIRVRQVADLERALSELPRAGSGVLEVFVSREGNRCGIRLDYLGLDARSVASVLTTFVDDVTGRPHRLDVAPDIMPFRSYAAWAAATEAERSDVGAPSRLTPPPTLDHVVEQGAVRPASRSRTLGQARVAALRQRAHDNDVTVSALILHALGIAVAKHSGQDRMGITVPVSYRPDGLTSETLGNFTELALCTVGPAMSVRDVHDELGRAVSRGAPGEREIARAGRAAYPVVFTSTLGLTGSASISNDELHLVWTRTSTPGVLLDCQVEWRGDDIHIRMDHPSGVIATDLVDEVLETMVDELGSPGRSETATPSRPADGAAIDPMVLMRQALALVEADGRGISPHLVDVAERWRQCIGRCTSEDDPKDVSITEEARILADCLAGSTRATSLLEHPTLAPQALLVNSPAFAEALHDVCELVSALPPGATIVELGSAQGWFRDAVLEALGSRADGLTWITVEPDVLLRDIARGRGVDSRTSFTGQADALVACASLHRDSRVVQQFEGIPARRCWIAEVPELTPVGLLSAALIEPDLLTAVDVFRDVPHWWSWLEGAGWRPTSVDAVRPELFVIRAEGQGTAVAVPAGPAAESSPGEPPQQARPSATDQARDEASAIVREAWARHLRVPLVEDGDDFFELGGDSLTATRILADLRSAGYEARLVDVFNHPIFRDFAARLRPPSGAEVSSANDDAEKGDDPQNTASDGYPLTLVQQAYVAGRSREQLLGGVSAHCYDEFHAENFDAEHFAACIADVTARHPVLRTVILPGEGPGGSDVAHERPDIAPAVEQHPHPRQATKAEVVDLSATAPMTVRWRDEGDGSATIGIGFENALLDGASMLQVLQEIGERYLGLTPLGLPGPQHRFDAYVTARPWLSGHEPESPTERTAVHTDRTFWQEQALNLPPAPPMSTREAVLALSNPAFERAVTTLSVDDWRAAVKVAARHAVTPAALVLACYAHALGEWSEADALTINVTRFDRDPQIDGIHDVIGDFTTLVPVGCHVTGHTREDVLRLGRDVRDTLAEAAEHPRAGTLEVQRQLVQRTGDPYTALLPVVFTCGLGLAPEAGDLDDFGFGTVTYAASQTPQTLLDMQVSADSRGLHLSADYVSELLAGDEVSRMLASVTEALRRIGADSSPAVRADEPSQVPSAQIDLDGGEPVARVWADVLGLDAIEPTTNFFSSGGDSLLATRCVRRLRDEVHPDITLRLLLTRPSYAAFVEAVNDLPVVVASHAGPDVEEGNL